MVTHRAPEAAATAMAEHGFLVGGPGRLLFLDAFSSLLGARSDASYAVEDPSDLGALASVLERAAAEHPDAVLVVDSLSTLLDHAGPGAFAAALPRLEAAMARFRLSAALFTRWPYSVDVPGLLEPFGAVVELRGVEDRVVYREYFSVARARWRPGIDGSPRLYRVAKPGGVVVYIPKVLVTGPYGAGKTTFLRSAAGVSASGEALGTTVSMDHGQATVDGLTADLFGTPGQSRFDPLLRTLAGSALGVIVVVDATDPDSFPRAREMMQRTWREGLPAIVAANKQDVAGALAPEEVARLLGAPEGVLVLGCVATDRASSARVLRELVRQILEGGVVRRLLEGRTQA